MNFRPFYILVYQLSKLSEWYCGKKTRPRWVSYKLDIVLFFSKNLH
ncbi:hypothetical protein RchiOBHm_Chr7g0191301 [Rosa chinensis]|uniref:Uncharacterized protein n=1 Tax=Rosa chinensis TaxID=74649 RepID=A0A2P6P5B7_ROSCH|nr:hypothetical protein RchiOBHm_Chr7g0191301 [Rosa chinensis]